MPSTPRPASLRRTLLALLAGGMAVAWLVASVATFVDARRHAGRILDAQLVELSEVLTAVAAHEALEIGGRTTLHDGAYGQGCAYQVFSAAGDLLLRSHDAPNAPLAAAAGFSEARAGTTTWRAFRRVDAEEGVTVIVAHDQAQRDELVRGIALRMSVPMLVSMPLLTLVLGWAVTRALRPLERVAAEVRALEPGRPGALASAGAPAEVQPLVDALNELLARLAHSLENERRFTGDAAHELRTPLAALRTQAEVALTTSSDERRRRALEQVVEGTERATRLVTQLLQLARLDAQALADRRSLDLAQPCREAVAGLAGEARERGVTVSLDCAGPIPLRGDPVMLEVLARNLVENAIRHAPGGGAVHVAVEQMPEAVRISVEDSGPGVAPALRERIFDRLFRAPGSTGAGSGLGLSIARRIVELHGGRIAAEDAGALGGLRVVATFPAAA